MELLRRYQKPGGFLQLVQLIETCNPQKQQQLLSSIEKESPVWAQEVKNKVLTIEKIFNWNEQTLAELISRVQELTLSIAVHGLDPAVWERVSKTLSHGQLRRIDDLSKTKKPTPAEISTAFMKIITEIREMISLGYIQLAKVDPHLHIDEDIEERLSKSGSGILNNLNLNNSSGTTNITASPPQGATQSTHSSTDNSLEATRLRKENMDLRREIQNMTNEINQLRTIIAQIKRAVA